MEDIGNSQQLATAFTFGLAALAFTFLPFIFVVSNGMLKVNSGHNAHSSSVLSVFIVAFIVHTISCVMFIVGIELLDILAAPTKGTDNYLKNTIFKTIFWDKISVSGSSILGGVRLQLYVVQCVTQVLFVVAILLTFVCGFSYAFIQLKKGVGEFDYTSLAVWTLISTTVALFIYLVWAEIATLALFMPDGKTILSETRSILNDVLDDVISNINEPIQSDNSSGGGI